MGVFLSDLIDRKATLHNYYTRFKRTITVDILFKKSSVEKLRLSVGQPFLKDSARLSNERWPMLEMCTSTHMYTYTLLISYVLSL